MIRFAARTLQRLIAAGVLLALLAGAPWALWKLGRPLLPDHIPGLGEIWGALTERDTGQILLGTLAVIGFIAWAVFAVSIVAELAAAITRRPTIRLPGLHVPQALAAGLIALIIATGPAAVAGAPAHAASLPALPTTPVAAVALHTPYATPDSADALPAARAARPTTGRALASTSSRAVPTPLAGDAGQSQPVWTVHKGDTLWGIAEATLGDPLRCTEIGDLNRGHVQPDGKTFTADDFLLPGWRILLPADAKLPPAQANPRVPALETLPSDVVVQPGDTLSEIALDTVGDAAEYPAIAAANRIADPDLIHPGQIIHILTPGTPSGDRQTGPQTETGGTSQQPAQPDEEVPNSQDAGTGASGGRVPTVEASEGKSLADDPGAANGGTALPPGNEQLQTGFSGSASVTQPGLPASDEAGAPASHDPGSEPTADPVRSAGAAGAGSAGEITPIDAQAVSSRTLVLGGITGLTAALAWAGLLVARRHLAQRRRPGEQLRPPLELEARVEKALRRNADPATPDRINQALRHATAALASSPSAVITGILVGPDAIELRPANPTEPPEPCAGTATAWTLPLPDADIDGDQETERLAALPALATIGTTHDGRIAMVNIEAVGAIHIDGDDDRCRELVNHLIVELSQTPWTDGIHLHLTDRPGGLRALDEDRVQSATDPGAEVRCLAAHAKSIRKILVGRTITQARTDTRYADAWEPHLLIVDAGDLPDDETTRDLIDLLQVGPPAAAGLITTGHNPGITTRIQIAADGTAAVPMIFPDRAITAAAVADTELAAVVGLYAAQPTVAPNHEVDLLLDGQFDATQAPVDRDIGDASVSDGTEPANVVILGGETVEAAVTATHLVYVAPTPAMAVDAANRQHDAIVSRSLTATDKDPSLDADLAEWHSAEVTRPKIAVLGDPHVDAPAELVDRPLARMTEYAVYLALQPSGVSIDKFVTDLWPEDRQPSDSTRRSEISRLRAWLGSYPGGRPFLPSASGRYQIVDRLLDCELFDRLRARAARRAHEGDLGAALADYQSALRLVRGPVLSEVVGPGYLWLANPERMEDRVLPMRVVDTAHAAVDAALTVGQAADASAAALVGRLVDPYGNIPLCDLVRIALARDDHEAARSWADLMMKINEVDVPADLPEQAAALVMPLYRHQVHRPPARVAS